MNHVSVDEWLLCINMLVDFSDIGSFLLMLENHWKGPEILNETIEKIRELEQAAWISPDYSTVVTSLETKEDNSNIRIRISFRLRTLVFQIFIWSTKENGITVKNAFKEMKKSELLIKELIGDWEFCPIVCNVLRIENFYERADTFKNWFIGHNQDLRFLPMGCKLDAKFTLSLSKLNNEQNEQLPCLVVNIRNNEGIRRRFIVLSPQTESDFEPSLYDQTVWFSFSVLCNHVINRILEKNQSILSRLSNLEKRVRDGANFLFDKENEKVTPTVFESVLSFYSELSKLENEFALVKDDSIGLSKNMVFLGKQIDSKHLKYNLSEEAISGNANSIANPTNTFSLKIGVDSEEKTVKSDCSLGNYCILCDTRSNHKDGSELSQNIPHGIGAMEETLSLIDLQFKTSKSQHSEITRSMVRIKSLISNLFSLMSTKVNLNLDMQLSRQSIEQKNILSKIEDVLETSENERKLTERVARTIELISLLFACFVIGEISSSFIIWAFQNIWGTNIPWWSYPVGFCIALMIAGASFVPIYIFIRKKWT